MNRADMIRAGAAQNALAVPADKYAALLAESDRLRRDVASVSTANAELEAERDRLTEVVELFQAAIRAHGRWCGYRAGSPGDSALNEALRAAAALAVPSEDATGEAIPALTTMHFGRAFTGTRLEDDCPCGKAPCGLVDMAKVSADCLQHDLRQARTMRQMHTSDQCPATGQDGKAKNG